MDLFDRIYNTEGPLQKFAKQAEGYFMFPKLEGPISNRMTFKGKEVIVWSVNNYLGLANHPEVRQKDTELAEKYGTAYPMGSRMMSGNTQIHEQLEDQLSDFVDKEDTILLNFGYQGILSAIDCVVSRRDVIVYDSSSHACIVDGVRLHQGQRFVFKHNDITSLENQLQSASLIAEKNNGGILVISEGVFGMEGDQGKLKEIINLKKKYDFRLMVDDAHGFGTLGKTAAGTGEEQGVQDEIDIYFATFAKAFGSIGAFISGDKKLIDFLKYNIRSQIFAKSLPSLVVGGILHRLEMIKANDHFKKNLWINVRNLQTGLKEAGLEIGNTNSCVTPVYMNGTIQEAMKLVYDLRENYHIFCSIVVYPVIPKGKILLRMIPTSIHTSEDIDETLSAFLAIHQKLDLQVYS